MTTTRIDDLPTGITSGILLDGSANVFLYDQRIPDSYVIVTKTAINKSDYTPTDAGTAHPSQTNYFLYNQSVTDIGNGLFEVDSKYSKVPSAWYDFEVVNIPYVKFHGTSVLTAGGIVLGTSYLYTYLNVSSIQDVRFFDSGGFTQTIEKTGNINVACRVKYDYVQVTKAQKGGAAGLDTAMAFPTFTSGASTGDGDFTSGYIENSSNPVQNVDVDSSTTFTFSNSSPSAKIKTEVGVWLGNIYQRKMYQIVGTVKV